MFQDNPQIVFGLFGSYAVALVMLLVVSVRIEEAIQGRMGFCQR